MQYNGRNIVTVAKQLFVDSSKNFLAKRQYSDLLLCVSNNRNFWQIDFRQAYNKND